MAVKQIKRDGLQGNMEFLALIRMVGFYAVIRMFGSETGIGE